MISIREETPADHPAIRQVTIDAFTQSPFGHNGEAELVDILRRNCENALSLVACQANEIVGHIFFTPATIRTDDQELHGMGLAPMSVFPANQKSGIGTQLMNAALERLDRENCPFAIVLGHPEYYPRFGFVPALNHNTIHGFAGLPKICSSSVSTKLSQPPATQTAPPTTTTRSAPNTSNTPSTFSAGPPCFSTPSAFNLPR